MVSLGNLLQCSVTLPVMVCLLVFIQHLLCFSLCPLALVTSLGTTEKNLTPSSLHPLYRCLYILMTSFLKSSLPQAEQSQLLASPQRRDVPFIILVALCWTPSNMSVSVLN